MSDASTVETAPGRIPVVGVGASAGGLEALEKFFTHISNDGGAAFVVVMHLDPQHDSMLVDLLARRTVLDVRAAQQDDELCPDTVYVIPPNAYLTLEQDRLRLSPLSRSHGTRLAIDHLFTSLARERGPRAVGIVLSGTGTDGTMGIRAIKAHGGMVMVQAPADAQYDGMPRSAIATELVDYVMPAVDLGEPLGQYLKHPYVLRPVTTRVEAEDELESLLDLLHTEFGHDFSSYARVVLNQRIRRRMSLRQLATVRDYRNALGDDEAERERLFRELLVGVTAFFRDPEAFEHLRADVLAPLAHGKAPGEPIRIWVPACASGEEAYSIAMLALDAVQTSGIHRQIQVFATEVDDHALQTARNATYPKPAFDDVPARLRERFIVADGDRRRIVMPVREAVLFAHHDVLSDPPFSKLDLVSCRNLLSFLEPTARTKLLARLHFSLLDRGVLFVGDQESIETDKQLFKPTQIDPRLAVRAPIEAREALDLLSFGQNKPARRPVEPPAPTTPTPQDILRSGMLTHFGPPAVLANAEGEVLYFHGELDPFLTIPSGMPTSSLFERSRPNIRGSVRATFHEAVSRGEPRDSASRRFDLEGETYEVRVRVRPLGVTPVEEAFLVVFDHRKIETPKRAPRPGRGTDERVAELELELDAMRAELEGSIAALRSSNEELKTSNEEISSMNEELQTSNEEMMSSKEELQSLNEELVTVNSQFQSKIQELEETNDDLENLLESTEVATVFLDRHLAIRLFTPSAKQHFRVAHGDIGRSIEDIVTRFEDPELPAAAARVQRTRQSEDREVLGEDGRWYSRRILPYRSARKSARGVLLTLSDIDLLKRAEVEVRQAHDNLAARIEARDAALSEMTDRLGAEEGARSSLEGALHEERMRLRSVLDTAPDAILAINSHGVLESANAAAQRVFGYPPEALVGMAWSRLVADAPPRPAPPAPTRSGDTVFGLHKDGRRFPMELSVGRADIEGQGPRYTVIIRDVSMRLTLEEQYRHAQKMEAIGRLTSGIAHDFNNLLMGLMGCAKAVLRRLDADSPARPYAAELEHAAQRGAQITRDLLTFTRRPDTETGEVDVAALVRDVQGILQRLVGADIEVSADVPDRTLRAKAGRGPVQQLLLNLVTNARDAIGGEGTINVRAAARTVKERTALNAFELLPGAYVTLTVEDDGEGMSPDTLERLFEPFFTTKGVGKGTGLGLSMVYSIVERVGGGVEVQSTRGAGSCFRVFLPAVSDAALVDEQEDEPPREDGPPDKRVILVVEDELLVRQTVVDALEEFGFEVLATCDGVEAKATWEQNSDRIDVVLTDVALPRLRGPQLIELLRAQAPDLRYLFMSAYPEENLRGQGQIPAEARSLQKPFDPETLYEAIDGVLE